MASLGSAVSKHFLTSALQPATGPPARWTNSACVSLKWMSSAQRPGRPPNKSGGKTAVIQPSNCCTTAVAPNLQASAAMAKGRCPPSSLGIKHTRTWSQAAGIGAPFRTRFQMAAKESKNSNGSPRHSLPDQSSHPAALRADALARSTSPET